MVRRYKSDPSARELFWIQLDNYVSAGGDLNDVSVTAIPLKISSEVERLRREKIDLQARLDLAEDATPHNWEEFWLLSRKKRYTTLNLLADVVGKPVSYLKECQTTGFVPAICFHLLRHSLARPMPRRAKKNKADLDYRDALRQHRAEEHYSAFQDWVLAKKATLKPDGFIIGQEFCNNKGIDEGAAAKLKKMFIEHFPEDAHLFLFKQATQKRRKGKPKDVERPANNGV